jgi:hypothetical protein
VGKQVKYWGCVGDAVGMRWGCVGDAVGMVGKLLLEWGKELGEGVGAVVAEGVIYWVLG